MLAYTTAPLDLDTDVTGPISLTLYAASSATDTDWTAKLVVVHPDGTAINLNNGIQRASYRDSLTQPSPITPGQDYRYTITIWPTSNLFHSGDRIRLEVSSSDFPQFDPNPNTGDWLGDSTATRQPSRRSCTTPHTRPRCCCRSSRPVVNRLPYLGPWGTNALSGRRFVLTRRRRRSG